MKMHRRHFIERTTFGGALASVMPGRAATSQPGGVATDGFHLQEGPSGARAIFVDARRGRDQDKNLTISQCYFIGEKNSSPVQGAIWAHGAGIHVDHCIFFGCRNALILIRSIEGFSLTNSIIVGAYEAAVWFGQFKSPVILRDNIVTGGDIPAGIFRKMK
jgi:hypothetical protein